MHMMSNLSRLCSITALIDGEIHTIAGILLRILYRHSSKNQYVLCCVCKGEAA